MEVKMKKVLSLLITIVVLSVSCFCLTAFADSSADTLLESITEASSQLSPNNRCPVQPTIYSSPRYLGSNNKGQNLKNGLSAKQIMNDAGGREYGLYFKFTPKGKNANGYQISRFDVTISDSKDSILYVDGFDSDMECKTGYYWYWNFFPLGGLFNNMDTLYGEIVPGRYTMDIYFNGLWAGRTNFTIKK